MEISGSMSIAAQEMEINKSQAGYDVLTKTLTKTEQSEQSEQNEKQRVQLAEHTGKGMNIDIKV